MSGFFSSLLCDLPSVAAPSFGFVSDCVILPPPDPIFDCPPIEIPPDPPAVDYESLFSEFSVPCPSLNFFGTIEYGDELAIDVTTVRDSGQACDADVSLDITIPEPPCPTFNVNTTIVEGASSADARLTFSAGPSCDIDVDFSIDFPEVCPTFDTTATITEVDGPPAVTLTFTPTVGCAFDVNLDIDIPTFNIADFCPTFNVTANISTTTGDPTIDFTITPTGGEDSCAYDVNLDITVPDPPCPQLTVNADATCGIVYADVSMDSSCNNVLDLFFDLTGCMDGGGGGGGDGGWGSWWSSHSSSCGAPCCGSNIDTSNVFCIVTCTGEIWYFNDCGQFIGMLQPEDCCPADCQDSIADGGPVPGSSSDGGGGGPV